MNFNIAYGLIKPGEELQICNLVKNVFDEFIASDYPREGVNNFYKVITADAVKQRLRAEGCFIITAKDMDKVIGMIEIRNSEHIVLFFIQKDYQGKGIASRLLSLAINASKVYKPELSKITVNSSPYAAAIYEHLGFLRTNDELMKDGIRFIPMEMIVE